MAHRNGAALIIINREETQLDHAANVVLHADVAEALPAIAARLPAVRAVHTRETKVT
jgi:NAD-dependent SIR2 family protein deacetylase